MESANNGSKIKSKSVGQVRIFEILGKFAGDFARDGGHAMKTNLEKNGRPCALFNLHDLKEIDDIGIQAILSNARKVSKSGVLTADPHIRKAFGDGNEALFRVLTDNFEVSEYFAREFAEPGTGQREAERRRFIRLQTILPLEFECDGVRGKKEFFGIVTNLSEGGLFAEYIHSRFEEEAKQLLFPDNGKFIDYYLHLSPGIKIKGKSRVAHGDPFHTGIGMEFLGISDDDRQTIQEWISKHLVEFGIEEEKPNQNLNG